MSLGGRICFLVEIFTETLLEDDIQNYETYLKNNTIYEITGQ
jgi:hypothetical protein